MSVHSPLMRSIVQIYHVPINRVFMDEFEELELDPEDKEEAQIIANEMIEILVRRSATIDMTWEALDILHSVMQELEEESFQEETMGLNGMEY